MLCIGLTVMVDDTHISELELITFLGTHLDLTLWNTPSIDLELSR